MLAPSRLGTLVTVTLHAGVLGALLAYAPTRSALFNAAPIMVDWITAPAAAPTARLATRRSRKSWPIRQAQG